MKVELESLAGRFSAFRSKSPRKKVVYPTRLRKAAAGLASDYPSKELAKELGVSVASIKSWAKKFAPNISETDFVAVSVAEEATAIESASEDLKVKIVAMEISVPPGRLSDTLAKIIQGMGASPC